MMTDRVRRNGQLSACEPCRKSKLRCDHSRPVCGRCARRRLSEQQCHYHPAPMAKQTTPQSDRETADHPEIPRSTATVSSPYELINMNRNLMSFADPSTPHPHPSYTALTRTGVALPQPSLPNQQTISEGAKILNDILELVTEIGEPLNSYMTLETDPCIHGPLVKAVWDATNNSIQGLSNHRSTLNLASISEAIFDRTSSPPVFPPSATAGALESTFSTQGLRWEMIGMYCAQIGIYLGGEKDQPFSLSAHETWKLDRKTLMRRAFKACIKCESFCDYMGAINDLTLWFLTLTILFATWCFGDDSYHALRLVGSMSSVLFALGFHKGVQNDNSVPFYMTEIRKRAIASAHDLDKVCASFTLRPVHLSRHFFVVEMPLDLADSALMGTPETLLKARENLDADGWSKDKAVLPVSIQRARLMLCMVREEALELKLGPAATDLEVKAGRVLQKLKSTWQSIPSHMKCDTAQHWADQNKAAMIHFLQLEYLYTDFLLNTLLAGSSEISRESMLITAQEILKAVLLPTRKRYLLHGHRADMEWALVFYAMPCASVLVLELLRQDQHPVEQLTINRSSIIQDISVLITCCDSWTEVGQSNYQICKQAQSIFSKSLDSILNHVDPIQGDKSEWLTARQHEHQHELVGFMNPEIFNVVAQDAEWMTWLESLGLQGDMWPESSIPTSEVP
ncbi:hypothetical protein GGI43DRAFT_418340 [Trichoderma evansii]